jgi:hypothetical protein
MRKNFVAVRSAYYKHSKLTKKVKYQHRLNEKQKDGSTKSVVKKEVKERSYKSAIAEFEHVLRTGKTNSVNVFPEFSEQNLTVTPPNTSTPLDAYYKCLERYKKLNNRSFRSDGNTLFEHVVVFSEEHVSFLEEKLGKERANVEISKCLNQYSKDYAEKYGFTFIGNILHKDEGFYDDKNNFKRNVHAHVMFFNYDFVNKKSNLRNLFKKGVDPKTGKTHELNPNFVDMQDLAASAFEPLKFSRGRSKLITMAKYLPKHQFLLKKLQDKKKKYNKLVGNIEKQKNKFINYFENWLDAVVGKAKADIYAKLTAESVLAFENEQLKSSITESVEATEKDIEEVTGDELSDKDSIIAHIKKKNNNKKRKI